MNNNIKFINKVKELKKRYKTRLTTPWAKNNVIEFHNSQLFKNNIKLRNRYNVLEKRIKFLEETINQTNNQNNELQKELQKALKNAEKNLKNHKAALNFRKNIFNKFNHKNLNRYEHEFGTIKRPTTKKRKSEQLTENQRERKRERDRERLRKMTPQQKEKKRQQVMESRKKRTPEQKERNKRYQREWYLRKKAVEK